MRQCITGKITKANNHKHYFTKLSIHPWRLSRPCYNSNGCRQLCERKQNLPAGTKLYACQGYSPFKQPNQQISPWYLVNEEERIVTPEYIFTNSEIKKMVKSIALDY